jgi:hypothetical protein
LNLATILTFVINRHLRRRSVYCLVNLAVVDMMYGGFAVVYCICVLGFSYFNLQKELRHFLPRDLYYNTIHDDQMNSLLSLVLVSLS